ncbi:MAG: hypothetical protein GOU97_00690 [Nanoarchaeota archaeon]|nr:hypothetical protein [Nanoarchaeota archaeon]
MGIDDLFYKTGIDFIDEHSLHFLKGSFTTLSWNHHKPDVLLREIADKAVSNGSSVAYISTLNEPEKILRNGEVYGQKYLKEVDFYRLMPEIKRDDDRFESVNGGKSIDALIKDIDVVIIEEFFHFNADPNLGRILKRVKNYSQLNDVTCFAGYLIDGKSGISSETSLIGPTSSMKLITDNHVFFTNLGGTPLSWTSRPRLGEDEELDKDLLLPVFELRAISMECPDFNSEPIVINLAPSYVRKLPDDWDMYEPAVFKMGEDGDNGVQMIVPITRERIPEEGFRNFAGG